MTHKNEVCTGSLDFGDDGAAAAASNILLSALCSVGISWRWRCWSFWSLGCIWDAELHKDMGRGGVGRWVAIWIFIPFRVFLLHIKWIIYPVHSERDYWMWINFKQGRCNTTSECLKHNLQPSRAKLGPLETNFPNFIQKYCRTGLSNFRLSEATFL